MIFLLIDCADVFADSRAMHIVRARIALRTTDLFLCDSVRFCGYHEQD